MIYVTSLTLPAALQRIAEWRAAGFKTRIVPHREHAGRFIACRLI